MLSAKLTNERGTEPIITITTATTTSKTRNVNERGIENKRGRKQERRGRMAKLKARAKKKKVEYIISALPSS